MHHSEARRQIEIVEEEIKRRIAIGSRASTQRIIKEFERVRIYMYLYAFLKNLTFYKK